MYVCFFSFLLFGLGWFGLVYFAVMMVEYYAIILGFSFIAIIFV